MMALYDRSARVGKEELGASRIAFTTNAIAVALLDAIPDLAFVLNPQRQIVAANAHVIETLGIGDQDTVIGLRPGELFRCVHAADVAGGCGASSACEVCGALNAMLDCLTSKGSSVQECRIRVYNDADGGALDLEVQSTFFIVGSREFMILALRDVSGEKRRSVLERTFFHDVLNIVTGLSAVAELLEFDNDPASEEEYKHDLRLMTQQISDEIMAQRQLLAAERGDLSTALSYVSIDDTLAYIADLYRNHSVSRGREIIVDDCPEGQLQTDPVILRRVLSNLMKNALEATPEGGTVVISASTHDDSIVFTVRNPGVIPDDIQKQIFQRSFSTKEGQGRGIGTHSVKLFTTRYLGGTVDFTSRDREGTIFRITLPRAPSVEAGNV